MSRDESKTEGGKRRRTPFIMVCVTATYFGLAVRFLINSNRKRVYLPLNQLDAPVWRSDKSPVLTNDFGTRLLMRDIGGHARAMEVITQEVADYQNGIQPNITELADAILRKIRSAMKGLSP